MWFWEKNRLVKYADNEARINAEFQIACGDSLERAAHNLLIVLLSGAGGGLALFVAIRNSCAEEWIQGGTVMASVYLFVLSALLVLKCMQAADTYPPANDPKNLYNNCTVRKGYAELMGEILDSKQYCIDQNRKAAEIKAKWLNMVSGLAAATPVIFLISAFIFSFFDLPC